MHPTDPASENFFEELYRAHARRTLAAAMAASHDFAWDATQHAFIAAWTRINKPDATPVADWGSWLRRTAVRHAIEERQRADANAPLEGLDRPAPEPLPEDLLLIRQSFEGKLKLIAELPERQRDAMALRLIAGFDMAEVASIMMVKEGTVRSLISQARTSLRGASGGSDE